MIQLPAADYPDEVAGPLLEQVAEQAEEFARNGYGLAVVGRDGLPRRSRAAAWPRRRDRACQRGRAARVPGRSRR